MLHQTMILRDTVNIEELTLFPKQLTKFVVFHPVYFQKTFVAPFGHRSPQLQGALSAHEQAYKLFRLASHFFRLLN